MKAVFIRRFGPSDVLELGEVPRPVPKDDEVLIAVHAASVNPRDWLIRSGRYVFKAFLPPFPLILGSDVSGVVAAAGRRAADRFGEGDEVYAMQPSSRGFGAYAEYVAVPASAVAAKPASMTHEEAAGVPLAGLTALQALRDNAGLRAGQRLLVIGASGGVGHYAVQLGRALGARVTGVTSTPNVELARSLGAERVIDYKRRSFSEAGEIYHAVFDTIGKESLERCAPVLARGGIYVTTIPGPGTFLAAATSRLRALVSSGQPRSSVVLVRARGDELEELARLADDGGLRTRVDLVYPLERAAEAHDLSRTFRTRGKLILKVR